MENCENCIRAIKSATGIANSDNALPEAEREAMEEDLVEFLIKQISRCGQCGEEAVHSGLQWLLEGDLSSI